MPSFSTAPVVRKDTASSLSTHTFDQKALATIETARRKHSEFRDMRVRALADVERLQAEEASGLADIQEKFGANSVDELRAIVVVRRGEISSEIKAFTNSLTAVEDDLRALRASGEIT